MSRVICLQNICRIFVECKIKTLPPRKFFILLALGLLARAVESSELGVCNLLRHLQTLYKLLLVSQQHKHGAGAYHYGYIRHIYLAFVPICLETSCLVNMGSVWVLSFLEKKKKKIFILQTDSAIVTAHSRNVGFDFYSRKYVLRLHNLVDFYYHSTVPNNLITRACSLL
jgi:hypothetical protein